MLENNQPGLNINHFVPWKDGTTAVTNVSCLWAVEGGNSVVGDQLSVTSKHATAWIQSGDNSDTTTKATTEILPTRSSKLKD